MLKNTKDYEVLSEIADEINERNFSSRNTVVNETDGEPAETNDPNVPDEDNETAENTDTETSGPPHASPADGNKRGKKKRDKGKPTPSLRELAALKKSQNLAERKALLTILAILLGVQLLFMNAIVLLIILWSVFDRESFRTLDANVLSHIFAFTKYYVTAVLVELLGGIIYIVHRVFSDDK